MSVDWTKRNIVTTEYEFLAENVAHFHSLLKKLNKRATKLGLPELVVTIVSRRWKDLVSAATGLVTGKQWLTTVQVKGESPKLAGWHIVGVIEHTAGGNLLRDASEGRISLNPYRDSGAHCDHCKTQRKRKETVILENEDGRVTRVGKNCLKDFLGGASVQQLMWYASWACEFGALSDEEGMRQYGSREPQVIDLLQFLGFCAASSRKHGYLSRTAAQYRDSSSATCDNAWFEYWNQWTAPVRGEKRELPPTELDYVTAAVALDWTVADLSSKAEAGGINDYQHNLQVVINLGGTTGKQAGYAGSILGYYQRGLKWAEEAKAKKALRKAKVKKVKKSEHVGEVDKRGVFEVVVGSTRELQSEFGCSYLVTFTTLDGAILKWFASREQEFEVGDLIKIKATVKKHDQWNDIKQTKVNRVVLA